MVDMNYGYIARWIQATDQTVGYVYSEDMDNPSNGRTFYLETPSTQVAAQVVAGLNATQ